MKDSHQTVDIMLRNYQFHCHIQHKNREATKLQNAPPCLSPLQFNQSVILISQSIIQLVMAPYVSLKKRITDMDNCNCVNSCWVVSMCPLALCCAVQGWWWNNECRSVGRRVS